jgi:glycosyltransferase involved in cell wall biosynthesis
MKHSILVFSSLFPNSAAPKAGLFIRERMFRVARHAELVVVSPVPWFPGQGLIRMFRKDYRPQPGRVEDQQGVTVYFPRFLAFPGVLRRLDGLMMYLCCLPLVKRLASERDIDIIDSHFTYPDGLAATWLARRLGLKSTITLRGTEVPHSEIPGRSARLLQAWRQADRVFAVSDSLSRHAVSLGADAGKFTVIGNGIDTEKFRPLDKRAARQQLGIDPDRRVLVTVGGLVERKGFHRVVECLPDLLQRHPGLVYLVVGGASAEGDYGARIRELAGQLGVADNVVFLGALEPGQLSVPLSAADAFVLASSNEGWANVILESMACGTPVIATDVGGNAEVICSEELGSIVAFGDRQQLLDAIEHALDKHWSVATLTGYARDNHWDKRVQAILAEYDRLAPS